MRNPYNNITRDGVLLNTLLCDMSMKLSPEEYCNKASVPYNKTERLYDACDAFFDKHNIDQHEFLDLKINTMQERDEFKVIGAKGNSFLIEYHYPNSRFKELLIEERIDLYKSILLISIASYFEHIDIDTGKINELRSVFGT